LTRSKAKAQLAQLLQRTGGLKAYHRIRNRSCLTTVMFHRVLRQDDTRWAGANHDWTISAEHFEQCLDFFQEHYTPVSCQQVVEGQLPPNPLLITFDDGWTDVLDTAAPLLKKRSLPSIVFLIMGALDGEEPWQEPLLEKTISKEALHKAWRSAGGSEQPAATPHALFDLLASRTIEDRTGILMEAGIHARPRMKPGIVRQDQVHRFQDFGMDIGSHGMTHNPLTAARDTMGELADSFGKLQDLTDTAPTLSFPHGAYSPEIVRQSLLCGYQALFTSDAHLNKLPATQIFGRIPIATSHIADEQGQFIPEALAIHLFTRPKVSANT